MKHCILGAAFVAALWAGDAHAQTRVYVQNNTTTTFTVTAAQTGTGLAGNRWGAPTKTIAPGQRAQVTWFNRDKGITNGKTFDFTQVLSGGGARLTLRQRLRGKLINSHMWQSVESQPFHDDRKTRSINWKAGAQNVRVDYRAYVALGNDDIEYILKGTYVTPSSARAGEFNVLAYNIYMRPTLLFVNGQSKRAELLPAQLKGYDCIVFSEAFDGSVRKKLLAGLKAEYPHATRILDPKLPGFKIENGGVIVVSKHPIEAQDQKGFAAAAGADKLAAKGVIYACIRKGGRRYHVFGSHTNAEKPKAGVRAKQFATLKAFIDSKKIPAREAVFIAGDLNVDMVGSKAEYTAMLKALNASHPRPTGHGFTFDPRVNKVADSGPPEYLDYVLYSNAHLKPTSSYNETRMVRAATEWKSFPTDKAKWDLSDHFAVFGRFVFP